MREAIQSKTKARLIDAIKTKKRSDDVEVGISFFGRRMTSHRLRSSLHGRLYSVCNPNSRERLRKVYESILPVNEEESYSGLLGPASKSKNAIIRTLAVHTGFSMLTALQLESKFDPNTVGSDAVRKVASQLFDMLFQGATLSK
jgi:hypothetical protein